MSAPSADTRVSRVLDQARSHPAAEFDDVRRMAESTDADTRLLALALMRRACDSGNLDPQFHALSERLVADDDNDCRWQAAIVIGEFIEAAPGFVWRVISRFGASDDEDMRDAIACVLLEHLLDRHPDRFMLLAQQRASESARFADTLRKCWLPQ